MTKKDYIKFATAMKDSFPDGDYAAGADALKVWTRTLNNLTRIFIDDNPNFSLSRFEAACGIKERADKILPDVCPVCHKIPEFCHLLPSRRPKL